MMISSLSSFPIRVLLWAGVGGICGKLAKAPVRLSAIACAISEIANTLFFLITSRWTRNQLEEKAMYALTNIILNAVTIFAMQRLDLIAKRGTLILTGLTIVNFIAKVIELSTILKTDTKIY